MPKTKDGGPQTELRYERKYPQTQLNRKLLGIKLLEVGASRTGMSVEALDDGLYCCVTDMDADPKKSYSICRKIPWATVLKAYEEMQGELK